MSNKYQTGSYIVIVFDKYGSKVDDHPGIATKVEADQIGEQSKGDGSFVVLRVVTNSIDRQSWHD